MLLVLEVRSHSSNTMRSEGKRGRQVGKTTDDPLSSAVFWDAFHGNKQAFTPGAQVCSRFYVTLGYGMYGIPFVIENCNSIDGLVAAFLEGLIESPCDQGGTNSRSGQQADVSGPRRPFNLFMADLDHLLDGKPAWFGCGTVRGVMHSLLSYCCCPGLHLQMPWLGLMMTRSRHHSHQLSLAAQPCSSPKRQAFQHNSLAWHQRNSNPRQQQHPAAVHSLRHHQQHQSKDAWLSIR